MDNQTREIVEVMGDTLVMVVKATADLLDPEPVTVLAETPVKPSHDTAEELRLAAFGLDAKLRKLFRNQ